MTDLELTKLCAEAMGIDLCRNPHCLRYPVGGTAEHHIHCKPSVILPNYVEPTTQVLEAE